MNIAFFADSYKPYISGVTNTIETLTEELRSLGHKVYILAPHYPKHSDADPDIFRFPSIAGGYPKFRLVIPVIKGLPEVDLIHAHSPFQAGLLARLIARRRQIPFVYSFHTFFTRYAHFVRFLPQRLTKLGLVSYLQMFCRGADALVAPTNMAGRVLRAWRIDRPISIIPSGVRLIEPPDAHQVVRMRLRKKYGIPPFDKVLLYVGRLSKEKNLPFLLQAFEKIRRRDIYLVLVGGGPLLHKLHKPQNVIFTGEIPHEELFQHYLIGDLFVFPSLTETQGLVLAEAKSAGLPVVALFAGGLVDSVRSGLDGYLVPRDLDSFTGHITRLLNDDQLREKFSAAARQDAQARFSARAVAKQFETLYNSLILNKRR